jgi:drug/metabolite transporter (DMT)-like permease
MSWFVFALLSAVIWGVENFLHKVAAARGYNSSKISLLLAATASILSVFFFVFSGEKLFNIQFLLFIAILNSITFFSSFITRLESLKSIDASVFFPVSRVGVLLFLVLLGLFTLQEQLTVLHWFGLLVSVISIVLLTYQKKTGVKKSSWYNRGVFFLGLTIVTGALANYTADIAASRTGTYAFIFLSYLIGIPFSAATNRVSTRSKKTVLEKPSSGGTLLGIIIGTLNFLGFVLFLLALRDGPLALVGAINNFSILLTIFLSILIHKEKPTALQYAGIVLAFLALMIFRN